MMKAYNTLVDDEGQEWELHYEEKWGHPILDPLTGEQVGATTAIVDFEYRRKIESDDPKKVASGEWSTLPPWATVPDEWKITLCWFDEDDDGEMTFWPLLPTVTATETPDVPTPAR